MWHDERAHEAVSSPRPSAKHQAAALVLTNMLYTCTYAYKSQENERGATGREPDVGGRHSAIQPSHARYVCVCICVYTDNIEPFFC